MVAIRFGDLFEAKTELMTSINPSSETGKAFARNFPTLCRTSDEEKNELTDEMIKTSKGTIEKIEKNATPAALSLA